MFDFEDDSLNVFFSDLQDPRIDRTKKYPLSEILFLSMTMCICGANSFSQIALMGESKLNWLRKYLPFDNGVPSHDTIGRLFSVLDPKKFQDAFYKFTKSLCLQTDGEIIAVDGKKLRASKSANFAGLYLVNAWAVKNGLALCHETVQEKSNEITAIPKLLDVIVVKGATVTVDAMGCQKSIAELIREKKADYLLALKKNQKDLHRDAEIFFDSQDKKIEENLEGTTYFQTIEKGHGRIETRKYYTCEVSKYPQWFPTSADWKDLNTITMVESIRSVNDKESIERRYYISSSEKEAIEISEAIRGHWGVENNLHWSLDMTFDDDRSTIRKDHAPKNFGIIKKHCLNLLRMEKNRKASLQSKRMLANSETEYLELLISQGN